MVIAAWILLILCILAVLGSDLKTNFGGILVFFGLLALIFLSATIIWEDLHSVKELWQLF
ncbi:hypothetical protein JOC34_000625 [Virgibacillus halotolerans]|uniref:hypothetical protein n=1 Tax=Virgibacillus halotolerans TaxID=1071053 RepID=UPI0019600A38|nr:hypothetical protein [Virgibacillus halotolerans]MBM7598268.1 hypothetical protein [Virgibacillus halotolerans]